MEGGEGMRGLGGGSMGEEGEGIGWEGRREAAQRGGENGE